MRKKNKIIIGLSAVILVTVGSLYSLMKTDNKLKNQFRATTVTKEDLEITILSTGIVQPQNRLDIKPPISGRIDEILVVEGQVVKKGQILAWMSSTERASLLDAARAQGEEELNRWKEYYKATPITAPIDGTIIYRNVESGQSFTEKDAVLVMSNQLTIKAQVDETDIAKVKIKQPVIVTLDAYPDDPFPAKVEKIAYDAKTVNSITTYIVDVLPDEIPSFMKSGMTANSNFAIDKKLQILTLPPDAIRRKRGKIFVFVKNPENKEIPLEKPITIGVSNGRKTEIVSGLNEGDEVLIPVMQKPSNVTSSPFSSTPPKGK